MFENIVDSWTEKENKVIDDLFLSLKNGDYINRIMILNSGLSDFTKNYILYEFDEESSPEDLKSRITKANKLYFNYALRPKWTLQTFLFNNFESRPPNEILKKLNIFTFYNYYTDSIRDSIKDNFQIFITKTELTSIIDSVNLSIYEKLSVDINSIKIKNFLLQLFLIRNKNESEYALESTIPYSFIKIFLEDKSYTDFENKFSVVKDLDSHTELSLKDIIKILTGKYNIAESADKTVSPEIKTGPGDKIEIDIESDKSDPDEEINETDSDIVIKPIGSKISNEIKPPDKSVSLVNTKVQDVKGKGDEKIVREEQLKKSTVPVKDKENGNGVSLKKAKDNIKKNSVDTISEKKQPAEENKIGLLFDEKRSEKILKKVYKGDLISMDRSLSKLKNFKTWDEAKSHLKEIFRNNDVDLYNKDVVFFVDKLNDHFKNK